mmetsp:Transcript_5782/g.14368  ORF Transcript_5782/g.14368 Transcript_5782/m.14368 type:complete len:238 (-) Transcript_5782:2536-3249(-)
MIMQLLRRARAAAALRLACLPTWQPRRAQRLSCRRLQLKPRLLRSPSAGSPQGRETRRLLLLSLLLRPLLPRQQPRPRQLPKPGPLPLPPPPPQQQQHRQPSPAMPLLQLPAIPLWRLPAPHASHSPTPCQTCWTPSGTTRAAARRVRCRRLRHPLCRSPWIWWCLGRPLRARSGGRSGWLLTLSCAGRLWPLLSSPWRKRSQGTGRSAGCSQARLWAMPLCCSRRGAGRAPPPSPA